MARMADSWLLGYLASHVRHMTLPSAVRCVLAVRAQIGQRARPGRLLRLRMRRRFPNNLVVREYGTDLATFEEVFIRDVYACAYQDLQNCRYIIDVGANIGLASVQFSLLFPEAQVFALEPDPESWLDNVDRIAIEFHGNSRVVSDFDAKVVEHGFVITVSDGHTVVASRPRRASSSLPDMVSHSVESV